MAAGGGGVSGHDIVELYAWSLTAGAAGLSLGAVGLAPLPLVSISGDPAANSTLVMLWIHALFAAEFWTARAVSSAAMLDHQPGAGYGSQPAIRAYAHQAACPLSTQLSTASPGESEWAHEPTWSASPARVGSGSLPVRYSTAQFPPS